MYEKITQYITGLKEKKYGVLVKSLGGYTYNEFIEDMLDDIYDFANQKSIRNPQKILEKAGIAEESYMTVDTDSLNGEDVFALIFINVLKEKFDAGRVFNLCENGQLLKWLTRLEEIDRE